MSNELVEDLHVLVACESPSSDAAALQRCADRLVEIGERRLGLRAQREDIAAKPLVRFGRVDAPVLLLGHLDTVHPIGTLACVPFRVIDGRATGPGVFDMKAGLVQALHALVGRSDSARLLVTSDEELGSPESRTAIEAAAASARAVFVLEPSSGGRLKVARKGYSRYELRLSGRAAHAGLEPGNGSNACLGLAHAILAVADLSDGAQGTTVTPTVARAGCTANTVPDTASLGVDVRAASAAEQDRVDAALRVQDSAVVGVRLEVQGGINRPPMPKTISKRLFQLARRAAVDVGIGQLEGEEVGGVSDGNFTAALGVETLDGLGAVGAGAHTRQEWIDVTALAPRTALLGRLIDLVAI